MAEEIQEEAHPKIVLQAADAWGISPDSIFPFLLKTVMRPKTDKNGKVEYCPTKPDMIAFLIICMQHQLNPFKREIYALVDSKGVLPIVGVDGWIDLIHRTGKFNGMEFDMEFADDSRRIPFCCTCSVWLKGVDRPIKVTEYFEECRMGQYSQWSKRPIRMMRHTALKQAVRICGTGNGLYDEVEAEEIMYGDADATSRRSEPSSGTVPAALLPENTEGSPVTMDMPSREEAEPLPMIDGESEPVPEDDLAAYSAAEAEEMAKNGDSSNSTDLFGT